MTHIFDAEIKLTKRVRTAIEEACQAVAWASGSDPFKVIGWIEGIEINERGKYKTGIGVIDANHEGGVEQCEINIRFEIDGDPKKSFWFEVKMAKTKEAGWVPILFRSGEPGLWFQQHLPRGYEGRLDFSHLTLINSRVVLETDAQKRRIFQFPFRAVPARVK